MWEVWFYAEEWSHLLGSFPTFNHALPIADAARARGELFLLDMCELGSPAVLRRPVLTIEQWERSKTEGEYSVRTVRRWGWTDDGETDWKLTHEESPVQTEASDGR